MILAVIGDGVWQALIAAVLALGMAWIARQNTKIHTLVNGSYGVQLKLSAIALRRVAILTRKKSDRKAAEVAEKILKEHEANKGMADSVK